jgi:hypothetical protein
MAVITALFDNNIDHVAELFIGVSNNATTAESSPNGIAWTSRTLPQTANWQNIAFGNDILVAICNNANTTVAASSVDGITWIARTITAAGASRGYYGCAFGNGVFVATTGGGATTVASSSTDGLTWTPRTIGNGDWRAVTYGNGTFIAVGYGSDLVQKSTDGITWVSGTTLPVSSNWIDITYDSTLNRFVAISATSGTIAAYSDDNGDSWTACVLPTTATWKSITTNNLGKFVAVANNSATYGAYSTDGITWSGSTLPATATWISVCYGSAPGVFSASAAGSTIAATSIDGVTWDIQVQINAVWNKTIYAPVTWRTGDSLTINNNARVTVNTNQNKFWISMAITNGELYITNSSTTTGNRFITGRVTGAAAQALTPGSGLGSIRVEGDWIQIGTGDTTANQVMTLPYDDYVPVIWVETGSTYEMWLNVSSSYGATLRTYDESNSGFTQVSNGQRGKFFVQIPNSVQDQVFIFGNSTTVLGSRTIVITGSTAGIRTGASISGTGIPASSMVEQVVNDTTLIINFAATAAASNVTVTLYNPIVSQFTNQIKFGDGINGNTLLMGQKVRVPNLMLTSDTPVNLQTATNAAASSQAGMSIVAYGAAGGGRIYLDTCLFGDAYHNFNQAQILNITDVGFAIPPAISEVYSLNINGLGVGLPPMIRAYSTSWIYRDVRSILANILLMSYITGAILNNIVTVSTCISYATAGSLTAPVGHLNISYSNNLTVSNLRCYSLFEHRGFHSAIALPAAVNNSTFTNIESYGCPAINIQQSSNNTFTNITQSESMFNYSWSYNAGTKITYDPETGNDLIDGTKYYFKARTFFTRDRQTYTESREYSSTPFLASGGTIGESIFPDYLTAYCSNNASVTIGWTNRSPVASYEVHRSTTSGFTISDSTKVYRSTVASTVLWTQFGNKPALTSTAATRTINFNSNKTITVSGSTAINFITDTDGATIGGGTTDWRVGDTLVITGSVAGNNGTYTISGVTANIITVNEDLITEVNAAGFVLTGHRPTINKFAMTADTGRTLAFNVSKTITASSGSFINDGHKVGDVITVSGTASNNTIFSLVTVTRLSMTVLETMVTEAAVSSSATITPFDIQNNTTYYYKLRKFDTASLYSDSAEIEVTSTVPQTDKNLCLRGTALGTAPWVVSNITVGAASRISPYQSFLTTATNQVADALLLTASNTNGTLTQAIQTTSGKTYTFSLWVCNNASITVPTVDGQIELGTAVQTFTANALWQKVSVTYTAISGATNAIIKIATNTQAIVAIGATVNEGTSTKPYLVTTTVPVINVNEVRDISLVRSWCRGYGEAPTHSGIEIALNAAVTGEMWTEVYCSSVKGFTPTIQNKIMNTLGSSAHTVILNQSSLNNVVNNLTQVGKGTPQLNGLLYLALSSSNNKFKNFTYDLTGCYMDGFISVNTLSNDNVIRYWNIRNWRNYVATTTNPIKQAANAFAGLTVENLIMNNSDFQILNIGSDIIIKGMHGANATPANNATTFSLGSTTDGIGVAYGAVYDTIFHEGYFTTTKGFLDILFNASAKVSKPYILTGSTTTVPIFGNFGKMFMQFPGDSVEYTWPHKIIGVSSFRNLPIKLSGLDLGTTTDRLEALKLEYSVKTTGDYGTYQELRADTGTTIGITGETLSASDGFYLKIKITTMTGMKYSTRATGKNFVVGEVIKGTTSLVQATVVRDMIVVAGNNGTGSLWLSGITGLFSAGETLVRASDSDARAVNVATNTSFALFPSFTSYIDGFQIYTNIDYSNRYPDDQVTLRLTGLQPNSEIRIFLHGTTTELDGIENSLNYFDFKYTYSVGVYVDIVIMSLSYQYYKIENYLLTSTDSSIPVQQIYDRVFSP